MPSSIEKILKIFKLESELNFENRAVVGGLEKFLPSWENEAQSENVDENLVRTVIDRMKNYRDFDIATRSSTIKELIQGLQTLRQSASPQPRAERTFDSNREPGNPQGQMGNRPQDRRDIQQSPRNRPRSGQNKPADLANMVGLGAPLTVLQGIGPRNAQLLHGLGLDTLADLLYFFPRRYDDYSQLKPINRLEYGEELTVIGTVQSISTRSSRGGNLQITEAVVTDGTGFLRINWFNQPWINTRLSSGTAIVLSGKIDMYLGRLVMNSPTWEFIEQEHLHTNRIVPVYPLTGHITQQWLRRMMHQTIMYWAPRITDYLPEDVRRSADLVDLSTALLQTHFPDSNERLKTARARLAFDEIFLLQLGVLRQKVNWQAATARLFEMTEEWLQKQYSRLPFILTQAQQKAIEEIRSDLNSGHPMNRLLQGDVGSGKTVVAAIAMSAVTLHGAQASLMAPTSILAEQHYRSLHKLLCFCDDQDTATLQPGEIRLLIGDTPETEKNEIIAGLADGSIKLVVGTHALLEEPVKFNDLQLLVVDEQHRFGVAQRAILRAKGDNPHLLVMTATPIPRSLALTLYGDLDLSVMDEIPSGRIPVETFVLNPLDRERAYELIRSQVAAGHQAFIIYPLIEKGENEDAKAAVDEHDRLQREVFPKFTLGLLHGRLKPDEKDTVMARFRDNQFQVLVSTTVIEVGVDIPNATVMVIEVANRFGLAQLHQLRGRVGRSELQSYCLLIPETENSIENERLAAMKESNDGFVLAERDLQQRGPGDFLGTRQAGFAELKMADIMDVRLIEKARNQAQALFEIDPTLSSPDHAALLTRLRRFWGEGRGDIS